MNNNNPWKSRRVLQEGRPNDYVYDPNYTICSQKDFYKDASYAARAGARIKLRPIFPTMFSELITDRRLEACLVNPRPNLLDNFMPQQNIRGIPVSPMEADCVYRREVDPTGADRAKFIMNYSPTSYQMGRPQIVYNLEDEKKKNRSKKRPRGFFVNRGVQTDYRESETQTDPYSPPFILPYPTAYPKVLALLKLVWGKGLPATLDDIVVIERALTRRMLEIGVHDVDEDGDFEKRVRLMEELEAQQWADREKELNNLMLQKMDLVSKVLSDLKTKIANAHTMKMEKAYESKKKDTVTKLAKIRHSYLRDVRRIEDKYSTVKVKTFKRDVVKEYLEFDSQVYTPLARNGPNIDMMYKPTKYKFKDHLNIDDLNVLTNAPDFVKNEMNFDPVKFSKRIKKTQLTGKTKRLELHLMSIYDSFRDETTKKARQDETAFMKQVITSTIHRMSTPTVTGHDVVEEHKELCILNLQKVIRGRVVQILMRDELKDNMSSILNLKMLHKADPYGLTTTYGQALAQVNLQEDRELQQEKQNEVTEVMDQLEGETLGRMFDFLDKEMVRLLDERKIHALMILAERERRMKEATEAGRRQKEEEERRVHDEIFRQIVGIHQSTIDLYLEDMYLETINRTSDANAREYVLELARTINEASYITNQTEGDVEKEELAAELVHCFMLPEMNRLYQRDRLDTLASRYTMAAKEVADATFSAQGVIHETLDTLGATIQEHMERGAASVDAGQHVVDNLIKGAVATMMQTMYPKKQTPDPDTEPEEEEEEAETEAETVVEDTFFEFPDDNLAEADFEPVSPKSDLTAPIRRKFTFSDVQPTEPFDILSDEERDEVLKEVQHYLDEMPPVIIPVVPEYKRELGEKSLQDTYGIELGKDAISLYKDTTQEVKDIFKETFEAVLLTKEVEDEESDEDSEDDDD